MRIDKGNISQSQFLFSVVCFIQSSFLLTALFAVLVKQDAWVAVVLGTFFTLPQMAILIALMRRFPGKTVVEINDMVFGRWGGKVMSLFYLFFFETLLAVNLRDMGDFVQKTIMPKTPVYISILLLILVCSWAVRSGVEVVTRYSFIFTAIALVIFSTTVFLNFQIMNPQNFLPVFRQPLGSYVQGGHLMATIPLGELVVFLMIVPYVRAKPREVGRSFFIGFLVGSLLLLLVVLRDTAILGRVVSLFALPPFESFRMTSLGPTLSRMEILFAIALIILMFFKIGLLQYVTTTAICQIFEMRNYKSLAYGVAAISVVYGLTLYNSTVDHFESATKQVPFLWIFFETLLPLVTLAFAALRGVGGQREEETAA